MTKTGLANGMSLVEIPRAGLSILCGCPENAVKFLIKGGQIREVERSGERFETGPNAILLSELPVQGGGFRNLGEFPVLQMLYRQGMIVPGHPNNTGVRPMIIGMRDQVEAQSRYIYSGNYGLSTVEELAMAGLDPDRAVECLRMKLRFAFGSIRKTEDLLDLRVFDGHAIELRDGVFVRRKGLNRYEFLDSGQSVEVDLSPGSSGLELPYVLPRRALSPSYLSIVHIGEGDGWDPDRPCMASLVQFDGKYFIIDAGPNIEASLDALGIGIDDLYGIFHTHAHDDHFVGLTALLRSERRLRYYAAPWVRESVEAKLRALAGIGAREFRMYFEVHDLAEDTWNDLDGLEVMPAMSPHPVETTVFRFRARGAEGSRCYAHLADIASFAVLDAMVEKDARKPGISRDLAARTKAIYLKEADVKKIDAGGGMIHGDATDFMGDESGRILLSHGIVSIPPGAGANVSIARFGDEEVLIAAKPAGESTPPLSRARGLGAGNAAGPTEEIAAYLRRNAPFADLSPAALVMVAATASFERILRGGKLCNGPTPSLDLIARGQARVSAGERMVETLGPGDVFGEEGILVEGGRFFEALALEPMEVCRIPSEAIAERPILLWRLRERLEARLAAVKCIFDFSWRPAYSVGESAIDSQHVELFALIGRLDARMRSSEACPDSAGLVAELADFARHHFATEEEFMRQGGYPELAAHSREHESILREVAAYRERVDCGDEGALGELDNFLKDWALKHTLLIDRQYMPFLPGALASRSRPSQG